MADKKISQLTAATTPLAGTEVLPIVQGGSTVQVSVDNLTAGKTVSVSTLNVNATGSSNYRLTVKGEDASSGKFAVVVQNSAAANLFWIRNDGKILTGSAATSPYNNTTGSAANLYVAADGELARSTSSLRYKVDVQDATHGLAEVLALRPVTYKGINDGDTVFGGLIAEEVDASGLTEFVVYDAEGRPDALHYGNMVSLLVKAVQELAAEVEALKAPA